MYVKRNQLDGRKTAHRALEFSIVTLKVIADRCGRPESRATAVLRRWAPLRRGAFGHIALRQRTGPSMLTPGLRHSASKTRVNALRASSGLRRFGVAGRAPAGGRYMLGPRCGALTILLAIALTLAGQVRSASQVRAS